MDDQRRQALLQTAGLFILLDRNGGRLSFTQAEYDAARERWGGPSVATIHVEISKTSDGPDQVEIALVRRPPVS